MNTRMPISGSAATWVSLSGITGPGAGQWKRIGTMSFTAASGCSCTARKRCDSEEYSSKIGRIASATGQPVACGGECGAVGGGEQLEDRGAAGLDERGRGAHRDDPGKRARVAVILDLDGRGHRQVGVDLEEHA